MFLVDLVVHERRLVHYLTTWLGRFDLFVVIVTAPWFIFVGTGTGKFVQELGDARWWSVVTLTTVGYGDIVPETTAGRVDGVMIMVTGIGILGLLAGSLANFFRFGSSHWPAPDPSSDAGSVDTVPSESVAAELAALRSQVERLADELGTATPPRSS